MYSHVVPSEEGESTVHFILYQGRCDLNTQEWIKPGNYTKKHVQDPTLLSSFLVDTAVLQPVNLHVIAPIVS